MVYLDYHSTTPCDPRVADVVYDCMVDSYGNPSSPHQIGTEAADVVDEARAKIANHIGAFPGELLFTSGATESNNIAIQGLVDGRNSRVGPKGRVVLTSSIEHKSVLKTAAAAVEGTELINKQIPVDSEGVVDLEAAREMIDDDTFLVSVQFVNNELGTIQPIEEIADLTHANGALFHCDAAQALGRLQVNVKDYDIDLLSLSAHKAYGPKGIGVLYADGGPSGMPMQGMSFGGGQESGLRPGTLNVPGIAGFGKTCELLDELLLQETDQYCEFRDILENELVTRFPEASINGAENRRVSTTTNIRFPDVEAEAVLARLKEVAVSTGSACESGAPEPSHVLEAIGLSRSEAYQCIRMAVGRFTTEEELVAACDELDSAISAVQAYAA